MTGRVIFLTHANVEIDPAVPVPEWGLNETGRARHAAFATDQMLDSVSAIFSSTERKAVEGAAPAAEARGLAVQQIAALGENDRSATGYLPPAEFWPVVERFFAEPDVSVLGWETARAAQARVVSGLHDALHRSPAEGDVLIVSHGGVGSLLRCHLAKRPITRSEDQPHGGGGCWFAFPRDFSRPATEWRAI